MPRQLPLTFQQKWLLQLVQRHQEWNCVLSYALRLTGPLSIDDLRLCFEEIISRHDSLRTRIGVVDGSPVQQINDPTVYDLEVKEVIGTTREQRDEQARRLVEEFSARPADPAMGSPVNILLLQLSEREHVLVVTLHRLITDCFSVGEVFRELWILYPQRLNNQRSESISPPVQYGNYAQWQYDTDSQWAAKHAAYWERRLAGAVPIQWPVEQVAGTSQGGEFGEMYVEFGAPLSDALKDLARRERALAAMAMLTVYVAVVSRWCGQKDFVVPFNIAGRQSENQRVIGYFSHVLYLRIQLTGEEAFTALLSRVSGEFFRALAHDDFGRMALQRPELLSGTLFQWISGHPDENAELPDEAVMKSLDLNVTRMPIRDFGGLTAIPPAILDVEISFFDTAEGVIGSGVYRSELHSADAMQRFMQCLRHASEQIVSDPGVSVASLPSP